MTVLVAGASGTTGSEVARHLKAEGISVRALTRSAESAAKLEAEGYEAVVADLDDPSTLAAALDGVDAVYVATTANPSIAAQEAALAKAAVDAGVGHFVKLSVIGASAEAPIDFARLHAAAEAAVVETGVKFTFLRPNGFMQNTLLWADQIPGGTIFGPVMDSKWSIVDVRDIAATAVTVLKNPESHIGETYSLTGPAASSPREQIAILSELLGNEITAQEVPIETALKAMIGAGWPEWAAERMGELFHLYADGLAEGLSPDIESVTGKEPRGYREFAADHLAAFGG